MLFISVLFSCPCWAVSFLNPETVAYSLESPVPRMSQECPGGCWFGPQALLLLLCLRLHPGSFLPFILFWWELKMSFFSPKLFN